MSSIIQPDLYNNNIASNGTDLLLLVNGTSLSEIWGAVAEKALESERTVIPVAFDTEAAQAVIENTPVKGIPVKHILDAIDSCKKAGRDWDIYAEAVDAQTHAALMESGARFYVTTTARSKLAYLVK